MIIIDNIAGESISIGNKKAAIEEAKRRVKYHNSEFNYGHYGKHYNQNAIMEIKDDKITIKYN